MYLFIVKIFLTLLVVIGIALPIYNPDLGVGVLREVEMLGLWGAMSVLIFFLVLVFYYCKDLEKTLTLVQPKHRIAKPKSVWLMFLIPYNFVEDFFIVYNISKSLRNEAKTNTNLRNMGFFGLYTGLGWATAQIVAIVPNMLGQIASLIAIVLWIMHWKFIRHVNRVLLV